MIKLTEAQKRVMKWLGRGWSARRSHGSAIEINGTRACNIDTIAALVRLGLVQQDSAGMWIGTEQGRKLTADLNL